MKKNYVPLIPEAGTNANRYATCLGLQAGCDKIQAETSQGHGKIAKRLMPLQGLFSGRQRFAPAVLTMGYFRAESGQDHGLSPRMTLFSMLIYQQYADYGKTIYDPSTMQAPSRVNPYKSFVTNSFFRPHTQ